jgi:hypothetical protein
LSALEGAGEQCAAVPFAKVASVAAGCHNDQWQCESQLVGARGVKHRKLPQLNTSYEMLSEATAPGVARANKPWWEKRLDLLT